MKISIITPSYNQGDFIEQTIKSVIDQDYPNFEYIIIDGGSTDQTLDIIKKYDDKISYWVSEPDLGQTDAINKGYLEATGDLINWLNSDDYLAPGALKKIAESFTDENIKAITTNVCNFLTGNDNWGELTETLPTPYDYIARSYNNQPGTYFRKNTLDKYFPMPVKLIYTMDQYLWVCFWLEHSTCNFKIENFTSTFFRRHLQSKTSKSVSKILFKKLTGPFFNEYNLIFWSFFSSYDSLMGEIIASYFSLNFNFKDNRISFGKLSKTHTNIFEAVFQKYLLELLKEDYRLSFFKRLNANIKYLKPELIAEDDAETLKQITVGKIHIFFLRIYRHLYWKFRNTFQK